MDIVSIVDGSSPCCAVSSEEIDNTIYDGRAQRNIRRASVDEKKSQRVLNSRAKSRLVPNDNLEFYSPPRVNCQLFEPSFNMSHTPVAQSRASSLRSSKSQKPSVPPSIAGTDYAENEHTDGEDALASAVQADGPTEVEAMSADPGSESGTLVSGFSEEIGDYQAASSRINEVYRGV